MTALRALLSLALLLALSCGAAAQTVCVQDYWADRGKDKTLSIAPDSVESLVAETAAAIGLDASGITVVPCTSADKVQAWYTTEGDGIRAGDYILYEPTWVQEVIGSNRTQAVALFGHELGHILGRHFTSNAALPRAEKELKADAFAGCAVARAGGRWQELEDLFSRIRPAADTAGYYGKDKSIAAVREGFTRCGGKLKDEPQQARGLDSLLADLGLPGTDLVAASDQGTWESDSLVVPFYFSGVPGTAQYSRDANGAFKSVAIEFRQDFIWSETSTQGTREYTEKLKSEASEAMRAKLAEHLGAPVLGPVHKEEHPNKYAQDCPQSDKSNCQADAA